jgi:uncharacterized protein
VLVAILQFEMIMKGAESLKDKRRVVQSIKDRLHREHQCSVAEVGLLDSFRAARMGLAIVGSDGRHLGQVLDNITLKLRTFSHEAQLGDVMREIISNGSLESVEPPDASIDGDEDLAELLRRRAQE